MRSRQRECGLRVIKGRAEPVGCAVTYGTIGGETGGYVVRVRGGLERVAVAGEAGGRGAGEGSAGVALRAGKAHVRSGERELRHGVVIKS